VFALPPPDPSDRSTISLGQLKSLPAMETQQVDPDRPRNAENGVPSETETEEGTPEYIRQRYFPHEPENEPTVEWMKSDSQPDITPTPLRFDLTGTPIPLSLTSTLPTHLGLHHHSDGAHAGYTLDDIFLLSRSTVPAQRATMLGVLAGIARRLSNSLRTGDQTMSELEGREEELRKRMVAAAVECVSERGSLGARAVELIYECIVCWDDELFDIEGVELKTRGKQGGGVIDTDIISSLPLEYLLPQISMLFALQTLPNESLSQLLAVLHRLGQHSDSIASSIASTPNLVANTIQKFLLTPIPPTQTSLPPNPAALRFLITLTLSSRASAYSLLEPADAFLRFLTMLPQESPYPISLATDLLSTTLRFYTSLASYGLYAHIATTAAEPFSRLRSYLLSLEAGRETNELLSAWAGLVEAWTVCATDPHRTTPGHDILWSQLAGWGWHDDVLSLRSKLLALRRDWEVWEMVWRAEAAWLEGARVNGVRGGKGEREAAIEILKSGFEGGKEKDVVNSAVDGLQRELGELDARSATGTLDIRRLRDLAPYANILAASIRLWLACVPPPSDGTLVSPPFPLPFARLSELCAKVVQHPLWDSVLVESKSHIHIFLRPLTLFLSIYLHLSRRIPDISEDLWMTQAFSILGRLIPGDEESAHQIVEELTGMINSEAMVSRGWPVPPVIWEKGGLGVIKPFLRHAIQPMEDNRIGPVWMSPRSIQLSTTQRLPSRSPSSSEVDEKYGLPLTKDWPFSPLDHLLRSGSSSVFNALPYSWDASEIEIVRASLLLTIVYQAILGRYSMDSFTLTREEVVFGCMRIFMLEHGQPQNDSSEEVFRDNVVGQFMVDLLTPFTVARASPGPSRPSPKAREDLEKVARHFLGAATPFYQYYTDFVALYDAISFAHPLFSRLLLPPTSLRYPLDYRRHLWKDFSHILRTVRVPFDQVIASDLGDYLWPVEDDPQMVGAYLSALLRGTLVDFVRLIAVHHIACNIWPDLRQDDTNKNDGAVTLFKAVMGQGNADAVRDVVTYRQSTHGPTLVPPKCFEDEGPWKNERLKCIERWGGPALVERLRNLLC
jgi:hypothetical protein